MTRIVVKYRVVIQRVFPVFISQLDSYGEGLSTPQVLNRTYNISVGTSRSTAYFLYACQQHKNIAEVQGKVNIFLQYRETEKFWNIRR